MKDLPEKREDETPAEWRERVIDESFFAKPKPRYVVSYVVGGMGRLSAGDGKIKSTFNKRPF